MVADPPASATLVARHLTGCLERAGIPYAIGGALAYGVWSVPRATKDVDINVFVEAAGLRPALDALISCGLRIDPTEAVARAERGDVVVGRYDGMRIDLFTASIPFCWEAMTTRVRISDGEEERWFLSAEAICLFKLLFFRSKDKADVEYLVATQGRGLDGTYVRRWLTQMMGEDDERVRFWDGVVSEQQRPA
ncbi:MAG: hypothetical protein U0166_27030 [Acidobacteriota bacterium]